MRNLSLTLAYDGTSYHGFQRQPEFHGPTVQGALESAWKVLSGEEINMFTAGRTDTGVHAQGQVVSFLSESKIPLDKIPKAFNSLLPRDIRILAASEVDASFNARRSAKWKRYDYRIDNNQVPDVFRRLYAFHEPIPLNVQNMQVAAKHLEGEHNFRAFAAAGAMSKTFERQLYHCEVSCQNKLITVSCIGDGFLYNMVRIIVGTLLEAGKGRLAGEDVPAIIASQDRKRAGQTALAHGLTLTYVHYGAELPREIFSEMSGLD